MFLVLLAYLLLSSTFVIGKAALVYSQPIFLIGTRMTLGGLLLLGFIYFFHKSQWKYKKEDFWLFAQIAFFHIYLSFILEFWSYQYVTSSKAAFMFNLSPFITALFVYIFFGEKMTKKQWLGLGIGFIGSLPILIAQTPAAELSAGQFLFLSVPEICLLISATAGVYGWIVMKKLVVDKHYSPIFVNGIGMFFGGIGAFITSFIAEKKPLLKCGLDSMNLGAGEQCWGSTWFCCSWANFFVFMGYVMLLILVANIIFYNFYGFLLKKYTPTFLSLVGLLGPAFTALLGWIFLGEKAGWEFFVSLAVVMVGAIIFYLDELKEEKNGVTIEDSSL
jgi:drug/metabolite transporter (DMT)-like permease